MPEMTIQMLNTKAEQALLQMFDSNLSRFPGGAEILALRRSAIGAFASKGLPNRRQEDWKYTDLKSAFKEAFPLTMNIPSPKVLSKEQLLYSLSKINDKLQKNSLVFTAGHAASALSLPCVSSTSHTGFFSQFSEDLPSWICSLMEDTALTGSSDYLLNSALFTDGAVIDIPDRTISQDPYCIFTCAQSFHAKAFSALRHIIRVGTGAKISILEFDNAGQTHHNQSSHLTQLVLADGAEVTHIKVVLGSNGSIHLGHSQVALGGNAVYKPFHLMLGDSLVRSSLNINFRGQGSTLDYGGASFVYGNGHIDNTLVIDHQVPRCTSRELFKGVLDDQAKAVFQGKVIVRPDAQKTDGKQMAQALMLSPEAEFDSKPELEIYADDVACGHGSTSSEIDPDLLFYCMSRGIPLHVARALLIESFIGEVLDKIENDDLRELAQELTHASFKNHFK